MKEHIDNAKNVAENLKELITKYSKHSHEDLEKKLIKSQKSIENNPENIVKLDFEDLFAIAFSYATNKQLNSEIAYERFLGAFNYAQQIFGLHAMSGNLDSKIIEKYSNHIRTIQDNFKIFYEVIRGELKEN